MVPFEHSAKRTIATGVFWDSVGSVAIKALSFISVFLVLTHLNVHEYGLVELALSVFSLFGIFLLPGLNAVVIADMGIEKSKNNISQAKSIYWNYFYLQLALSIIAWSIVFFGSHLIASVYGDHISTLVQIVSFLFLLSPFRALYMVLYSVHNKFFTRSVFSFIEEFGKLSLLVACIFLFDFGIKGIIFTYVGSQVVSIVCMLPSLVSLYRKNYHQIPMVRLPFLFLLKEHGKWGIMSNYMNIFGQNVRLWVIKGVLGTEAVGLFSLAQGLLNNTISLISFSNVLSSVMPQYVHVKEKFHRIANKAIKYQLIAYLCVGVIAFFAFPSVLALFFPQYVAAFPLYRILLLSMVPNAFAVVLTPMIFALKAQKDLFAVMTIKAVAIGLFGFVCMSLFGLYGIAYEFILVTCLYVFERYRRIKKISEGFSISRKDIFSIDENDDVIIDKVTSSLRRAWGRVNYRAD
jgi:O-antigen/teichoic acid export membrane protein